jgi:hypothetical protein
MSQAPITRIHRREWQRLDTCGDGEEGWLDHHQATDGEYNGSIFGDTGSDDRNVSAAWNKRLSESTKVSCTWIDVPQFLRDNNAMFGIVETEFYVGFGIQMFNSSIRKHGVFDGIRMYSRVVNTSGPTVRTPKWIHEQGWIRGLVHRSITAYGELATLGVKHESENCMGLVHANMKEPVVRVD